MSPSRARALTEALGNIYDRLAKYKDEMLDADLVNAADYLGNAAVEVSMARVEVEADAPH